MRAGNGEPGRLVHGYSVRSGIDGVNNDFAGVLTKRKGMDPYDCADLKLSNVARRNDEVRLVRAGNNRHGRA